MVYMAAVYTFLFIVYTEKKKKRNKTGHLDSAIQKSSHEIWCFWIHKVFAGRF